MTIRYLTGFFITFFAFETAAFAALSIPKDGLLPGADLGKITDDTDIPTQPNTKEKQPGQYCRPQGFFYSCEPGCYCDASVTSCVSMDRTQVVDSCKNKDSNFSTQLAKGGINFCPTNFPNSAQGAKGSESCYFETSQGQKVYNIKITCPAGKYLPKDSGSCRECEIGFYCEGVKDVNPSNTENQGIKACGSGKTTTETGSAKASACVAPPNKTCAAGTYSEDGNTCVECPGGFYCEGGTSGKTPCPSASPEHWRDVSTFPDEYHAADGENAVTILARTYIPKWKSLSGNKTVSGCRIVYEAQNLRGRFNDEATKWNPNSGKYDIGGLPYYISVNPGFYMSEKLTETYCDEKNFSDGARRSMLYKRAVACPADKYCPGVKQTFCDSGEYKDTLGLKDPVKVTCAKGYYLPAFTELCEICPANRECPGGEYYTKHFDQGAYVAFTQLQLMYGPNGKAQGEPEGGYCWKSMDSISYKNCMLGNRE